MPSPTSMFSKYSCVCRITLPVCWRAVQAAGLHMETNNTLSGAESLLEEMPGHQPGVIRLWIDARQSDLQAKSVFLYRAVNPLNTDPSTSFSPSPGRQSATKNPAWGLLGLQPQRRWSGKLYVFWSSQRPIMHLFIFHFFFKSLMFKCGTFKVTYRQL